MLNKEIKNINKKDLTALLSKNIKLPESMLLEGIDLLLNYIKKSAFEGRKIEVRGFGKFWAKESAKNTQKLPYLQLKFKFFGKGG